MIACSISVQQEMAALRKKLQCSLCGNCSSKRFRSLLPCGHSFCTICVHEALLKSSQCPTCKAPACPKDVGRMYIKEEWLEGLDNFEAFVYRCPWLNMDMPIATSEDGGGAWDRENLAQRGREAQEDLSDNSPAMVLVPASPKRALENPEGGTSTGRRKVADTYVEEGDDEGLDGFYDRQDGSLCSSQPPSEKGCIPGSSEELARHFPLEDEVPRIAPHDTAVEPPACGKKKERGEGRTCEDIVGKERGEGRTCDIIVGKERDEGRTCEDIVGSHAEQLPTREAASVEETQDQPQGSQGEGDAGHLGEKRGVVGARTPPVEKKNCSPSPVEASSESSSVCEYMERIQALGSNIKQSLQRGSSVGEVLSPPSPSASTASVSESPAILATKEAGANPVCPIWACSSASPALRKALLSAHPSEVVATGTKTDPSRNLTTTTVFAVPSEMRGGLRCCHLTRDLALALAMGDLVVDCGWVQSVLQGDQDGGKQAVAERLRDESYQIKGVVSGQEVVERGRAAPRDASTGRSTLLAGLDVMLEGHDEQAVFTQDDVAFLLYCSGADVLGVTCTSSSDNGDTITGASLEESLVSEGAPEECVSPSQSSRLKLCLGSTQPRHGSPRSGEEQEEGGGAGEDLRWLIRTLILQNPSHSS